MNSPYNHTDACLLEGILDGNEESFRQLFQRYHQPLYFVAFRYLKEHSLAEDAIQDIFVKLWVNRATLNKDLSLKGYLFTALKNHVLNVLRHKKVVQATNNHLVTTLPAVANATENHHSYTEYSDLIEMGIQKLSPQKQEVFRLRTFHGMDNAQVADHLGISINTVKFQFSQATKFLRDYLRKQANI